MFFTSGGRIIGVSASAVLPSPLEMHKPSWRSLQLTHPRHRATRIYTGLGKETLGGHKQNLVCTRTQEKGTVTPKEIDPGLSVSVQESPVEVLVGGGLVHGQGH